MVSIDSGLHFDASILRHIDTAAFVLTPEGNRLEDIEVVNGLPRGYIVPILSAYNDAAANLLGISSLAVGASGRGFAELHIPGISHPRPHPIHLTAIRNAILPPDEIYKHPGGIIYAPVLGPDIIERFHFQPLRPIDYSWVSTLFIHKPEPIQEGVKHPGIDIADRIGSIYHTPGRLEALTSAETGQSLWLTPVLLESLGLEINNLEELIERGGIDSIIHDEDKHKWKNHLLQMTGSGVAPSIVIRLRSDDDSFVHLRVASYLSNPNGLNEKRILHVFTDVTAQMLAEEKLRRLVIELSNTQRVLSSVIETIPTGVVLINSDNYTIELANRAAKEMVSQLSGLSLTSNKSSIFEFISHTNKSKFDEAFRKAQSGQGSLFRIDLHFVNHNDGRDERILNYVILPVATNQILLCVDDITDQVVREEYLRYQNRLIEEELNIQFALFRRTIEVLAPIVESNDDVTAGHTKRVQRHSMRFSGTLKLNEKLRRVVEFGSILHDIGKLGVPADLLKANRILEEVSEIDQLRRHVELPERWFENIEGFEELLGLICNHHQRWDGFYIPSHQITSANKAEWKRTGYPSRHIGDEFRPLRNFEIPFEARMFSLVDVWDALRSERPYKLSESRFYTLEILLNEAGKQFDPYLTALFIIMQLESEDDPDYKLVEELGNLSSVLLKLEDLIDSLDFAESDLWQYTEEPDAIHKLLAKYSKKYAERIKNI